MVKLTTDIVESSVQKTNCVRERELNLRDLNIATIENLGATRDQFDILDFTNNDIRRVDGSCFPVLERLSWLLLSNNRITHITSDVAHSLPNLQYLILINNNLQDFHSSVDQLVTFRSLRHLSLIRNPVASLKDYRLYTIFRLPQLMRLDFSRVKKREREEAEKKFKHLRKKKSKASASLTNGSKAKSGGGDTFTPGGDAIKPRSASMLPRETIEAITRRIKAAASLEEVDALTQALKSGKLPTDLAEEIDKETAAKKEEVVQETEPPGMNSGPDTIVSMETEQAMVPGND